MIGVVPVRSDQERTGHDRTSEHWSTRLPNDIGGLAPTRSSASDHELAPWEKRCHALADVLDFHKIINTEEKRRGVEALGTEMIGKLTYYERWIVAFAEHPLPEANSHARDLAPKMHEVEERWSSAEGAGAAHGAT